MSQHTKTPAREQLSLLDAPKKEHRTVNEQAAPKPFGSFSEIASFIWSIADLLRGDFKRHEYGQVILPFTVLRRLDCVLEKSKPDVLATYGKHKDRVKDLRTLLEPKTGVRFYNVSKLDLREIVRTGQQFDENLMHYIEGFEEHVKDIFLKRFRFQDYVERLERGGILLLVLQKFAGVDLHPDVVDNHTMGSIFEELIRKFAEVSNETAGEHFTPRDVVRMMVDLLFSEDEALLRTSGIVRTLYDPACGTGGMLSVAQDRLHQLNPKAQLEVFGQELNDESFAICKSDMMIKGQNPLNVVPGNSFTEDGQANQRFHYMLSNPPFGVEWKKIETFVKDEHDAAERGIDPVLLSDIGKLRNRLEPKLRILVKRALKMHRGDTWIRELLAVLPTERKKQCEGVDADTILRERIYLLDLITVIHTKWTEYFQAFESGPPKTRLTRDQVKVLLDYVNTHREDAHAGALEEAELATLKIAVTALERAVDRQLED